MKRYVKGKAESVRHQVFRYGVGGNASTIADFSLLAFMIEVLRVHFFISAVVSFIVGVFVSYIFNIYWVFHERKYSKKRHEFGIFILISVVGLVITSAVILSLTKEFEVHYLMSKVVASASVFFWNFFARKQFLFKSR